VSSLSDLLAPDGHRLAVDVEKRLPGLHLRVQLAVDSEILVLFGPSGAGKTTTLNIVAGLTAPEAGTISLDGHVLLNKSRPGAAVHLPARRRRIGYVFQQYALFPHLTALQNVAYPLHRGRWTRRDPGAVQQAQALLARMHMEHMGQRYPHELSGGQQQRVAIARALAAQPRVLLLDEPFAALDAAVRERLQLDLAALQAEQNLAVIYVTHRLEDAFAIGHRLAILAEGQVQQIGRIDEVFQRPANDHVAQIMGLRNLLQARVLAATPEHLLLDWNGLQVEAPPQPAAVDSAVTAYIRPEDIKILYPDRPLMGAVQHNQVDGVVLKQQANAGFRRWRVLLSNGHEVELSAPVHAYASLTLQAGQSVRLSLRREAVVVLRPAPLTFP
jgi:molybdate transport system ATP-binding protein